VSDRYPCKIDSDGNINNIFIPDQIRRHRDGIRGRKGRDASQWYEEIIQPEHQFFYSASYGDYRAKIIDQNNNNNYNSNRSNINVNKYSKINGKCNVNVIPEVSLECTQDQADVTAENNNIYNNNNSTEF